jgi:O-antigen ligase
MNLSYFQGYNRIVEEGFAEMDNNSVAIGMVTCLWLGFFLGLSAERWWQKAIALVLAGLMGHTVMIAFSRGGMLAILVSGLATFLLIPKKPRHYLAFALAVVIGLRLAGPEVRQRFFTTFAGETDRESSAGSRLALWKDCLDCMVKQPLLGVGPDHWPLVAASYGWPAGKEAHSLWLQLGAELGIPGLLLLLLFYGSCMGKLWPLTRERTEVPDPWLRHAARMVIASIVGFAAAAQFVSLKGLEVPFYVALVGAGALKLASAPGWYPEVDRILPGRLRPINTKTQTVEA